MGVGPYGAILETKAVGKQRVGQLLHSPSSLFPCPISRCPESWITPFPCRCWPCLMEGLEMTASGTRLPARRWERALLSRGTTVPQKHAPDPNEAEQVVHPAPLACMHANEWVHTVKHKDVSVA